MKRMFLLPALLSSAAFLVSCGGGGSGGPQDSMAVAAEDLEVRVDATNGPELFKALGGESFTYDEGVPDFETSTATKVEVVEPAAGGGRLGFRISSGGNTATGALEFGSCRFDIRGSTYPTSLRVGTVKVVKNCLITVRTRNLPVDGSEKEVRFEVTLNGKVGVRYLKVRINANGTLVMRNVLFGTVKVRPITGTGSW